MTTRCMFFAVLLAVVVAGVHGAKCPPPCPPCPDVVPCPVPTCPVPKCPPMPDIPPCSAARCPALPEIPACPPPVLNLSCPNVTCPPQSCPPCPPCPASPTCPPCSSNASASAQKPLPAGYARVPGMEAYKFYTLELNWSSANSTCASDGGYLAVPKTQAELDMLISMQTMQNEYNIHVGFSDLAVEGTFVTVLGQPMTRTQEGFWRSGEPDSGNDFDCAYLNKSSGRMSDQRCSDREPFVCEIKV